MSAASPCFTPGTLIATDRGRRPVETLRRGDRVVTRDNGLKKIAWIGRRDLTYGDLVDVPELCPVLVRRGAFGDGRPERDMLVSPAHRLLVKAPGRGGWDEVLIGARHLTGRRGVEEARVLGVSYLHLLFDVHEVILADGLWAESFHPDDRTLGRMARRQRDEVLALFPEIETLGAARRFPPAREPTRSRFDG